MSALVGAVDEFDAVDDDDDDDNSDDSEHDGHGPVAESAKTTTKPLSASQHVRLLFTALHSLVVETDLVCVCFLCLCLRSGCFSQGSLMTDYLY